MKEKLEKLIEEFLVKEGFKIRSISAENLGVHERLIQGTIIIRAEKR